MSAVLFILGRIQQTRRHGIPEDVVGVKIGVEAVEVLAKACKHFVCTVHLTEIFDLAGTGIIEEDVVCVARHHQHVFVVDV